MGDQKIGFAEHVGKFDSLLDTLGDEGIPTSAFESDDGVNNSFLSFSGSTLELLKSRHDCRR